MKKYIVGICDDEHKWCEYAKKLISNYADTIERNMEVLVFSSRKEILSYEGEPIDAVFMDIQLKKESGINVASELNKKWMNCAIVYLTNYLFYATDTYQTEHVYFVLKEQFEQRLKEVFDKLIHLEEQGDKSLCFELLGGKNVCLAPNEILYFERETRRTYIHTIWGKYETWQKVGEIEKILPEIEFVRCHNSYIVYFPAVRELNKNTIVMKDDTEITVSRSYIKKVKNAFAEWAVTRMS